MGMESIFLPWFGRKELRRKKNKSKKKQTKLTKLEGHPRGKLNSIAEQILDIKPTMNEESQKTLKKVSSFGSFVLDRGRVISPSEFDSGISRYKFTVVVFFRGSWNALCGQYLDKLNKIKPEIQALEGNLIAVCAQERIVLEQEIKDWRLVFDICCDMSYTIAKRYNMETVARSSVIYEPMVDLFQTMNNDEEEQEAIAEYLDNISCYLDGVAQPGVLVILNDSSVIYAWKGDRNIRTGQGSFGRVEPKHVLAVVKSNFDESFQIQSKPIIEPNMEDMLFEFVLSNASGRQIFNEHLQCECNTELLEAWTAIEEAGNISDKAQKHYALLNIVKSYIMPHSAKEVNIPLKIRKPLVELVEESGQFLTLDIFDPVKAHIRLELREPFSRFLLTPRALELVKHIPQCFSIC
jgi:peroxiredoxin